MSKIWKLSLPNNDLLSFLQSSIQVEFQMLMKTEEYNEE